MNNKMRKPLHGENASASGIWCGNLPILVPEHASRTQVFKTNWLYNCMSTKKNIPCVSWQVIWISSNLQHISFRYFSLCHPLLLLQMSTTSTAFPSLRRSNTRLVALRHQAGSGGLRTGSAPSAEPLSLEAGASCQPNSQPLATPPCRRENFPIVVP